MAARESAAMSSDYNGKDFVGLASHAIDGDLRTQSITNAGVGNWLSVLVPPNTSIGYVALFNFQNIDRAYLLTSFEVWVGVSMGDTSSATAFKCGEAQYSKSKPLSEPYVLWCAGTAVGQFVTVTQTGALPY